MRRYEPLLKIAAGGTATVYVGAAAGDLGFRQLVAIKRPHAHLADDLAFRAALLDEAKIAARIRHANVVDVRDVEADEHGIQLVMDWVEGASLSDLIRSWCNETPDDVHAVALRIVIDACEGLRAVHELAGDDGAPLGLVHRDVSPANVLVGLDGVARITDFGLAKPLAVVERTTSEGTLRGKLGYMAPEYVRGGKIDARVDVFAMGVVLWEALARKRLFRGENDAETLERVQRADPPRLVAVRPELGVAAGELDAIVSRALAKSPDARYASVELLVKDLERIARAHDLFASHADVRASFGAALRAGIEERRRRVHDAINATPPQSSPQSSSPPSDSAGLALAAESAAPPRRTPPRFIALAAFAAVAVGAGLAGAAVALRAEPRVLEGGSSAPREIRALAADVSPRIDAPRTRAEDPRADASSTPTRVPRRAAPPEPGNKPPRPNPYTR